MNFKIIFFKNIQLSEKHFYVVQMLGGSVAIQIFKGVNAALEH